MNYVIHFDLVSAFILLTVIIANQCIFSSKSLYNKIYNQMAIIVEVCCLFDIVSSVLIMNPFDGSVYNYLLYITTMGYYITQMIPVTWITLFFYAYIRKDKLTSKQTWFLFAPLIISELLVLSNPITGWMFTINDGAFGRGPFIGVLYIVMVVYLVWASVIVFKSGTYTDWSIRLVYYSYVLLSTLSLTIQFLMPKYLVECTAMTILILIIHYSVQNRTMLEEAVKKERELAEVADKINVMKSKFIFEMSHEIRTPMNAIIGMSTIARQEIENKEQAIACLDSALTSAQHLMALLNNIIEMNDIVNGTVSIEPKPVIMKNEVYNIVSMMRPLFEEKEQILQVIYNGDDDYYVMADTLRIDQIMIKILTNASSFMEKGKKAVFEVNFSELNNGRMQYCFDIVDEGVGMDSEFIKRIGEPFERERSSTESGISGTGLGIAVVKKLISAMNADMDIESVPNKGTRFCLRFTFEKGDPIVKSQSGLRKESGYSADKKNDSGHQSMKGILSLIVEDNEVNIRILSRALRRSGSAVIIAKNGLEAVEKVNKIGLDRIGVIFMDLQMPIMDGFEATKAIRDEEKKCNTGRRVPIYAVTANTATEDCNKAFEAGVDGIFAKPVHFEEFFERLSYDGVI